MGEDARADLLREIERDRDSVRLLVVPEAAPEPTAEHVVERVFPGVAEGRVAHVVTEADRLDEILVQPEGARDDSRDRGRLEGMRHSRPVVVAARVDEHLRLSLEPAERLRVHD